MREEEANQGTEGLLALKNAFFAPRYTQFPFNCIINTAPTSLLFMVSILVNCLVTPVLLLEMLTAYRLGVLFVMSASTLRSGDNLRFLLRSSLGYLK